MTILIAGATGATGRLLTAQLLERGLPVRVIVRSAARLPDAVRDKVDVVEAPILDLSDDQLAQHVEGCTAVASCLGHNLSFKGIWGKPRRLVTDATRRLCAAIASHGGAGTTKFVLMNTTGNRNRDLDEKVSLGHRAVVGLIRLLVPPHRDNELAADHLRVQVGQEHPSIAWVVVRPDGLTDADTVTPYDLHPSPTRDAIFDAGKTSRINVAHFMASLITDDELWARWQGQMPVIYNREAETEPERAA